jgi:hypothetical protein
MLGVPLISRRGRCSNAGINKTKAVTELRGRVVKVPTSHSGGPRFKT